MSHFSERTGLKYLLLALTASIVFLLLTSIVLQPAVSSTPPPATPDLIPVSPSPQGPMEYQGIVYQEISTANYSVGEINAALRDCPNGEAVMLAAGTYILDGVIKVPEGRTLVGSTDGAGGIGTVITTNLTGESIRSEGYIDIGEGMNVVRNIKTLNGYFFHGINSHDFLFQDCEYNGPTDIDAGQYRLYGFFIYIAANGNYDNGQFLRCAAKNAPCYGFLVMADGRMNSDQLGADAYSAHGWSWTKCQAYDCGVANINYPESFVYGCGFDFFEGFGAQDNVSGMRITGCVANGNAADGFHIEYLMNISDCVFDSCTANNNGQWFKMGHTTNPSAGLLVGTGFWLGGAVPSQTKVLNCLAQDNWGYSTLGGGYGMIDSKMHTDQNGTYAQGTGAS